MHFGIAYFVSVTNLMNDIFNENAHIISYLHNFSRLNLYETAHIIYPIVNTTAIPRGLKERASFEMAIAIRTNFGNDLKDFSIND